MGLMGLLMAYYEGLKGILSGCNKSTDHASRSQKPNLVWCFGTNSILAV